MDGRRTQDQPVEVRFPDADLPYLFVAALRRRVGDSALTGAFVVPSVGGPVVLLAPNVARDEATKELLSLLEGSVVDPAGAAGPAGV